MRGDSPHGRPTRLLFDLLWKLSQSQSWNNCIYGRLKRVEIAFAVKYIWSDSGLNVASNHRFYSGCGACFKAHHLLYFERFLLLLFLSQDWSDCFMIWWYFNGNSFSVMKSSICLADLWLLCWLWDKDWLCAGMSEIIIVIFFLMCLFIEVIFTGKSVYFRSQLLILLNVVA